VAEDTRHVIIEDEALAAGFTQIPNLVLRRSDLQPGAKLTYMVLLSYAWQQDHAYPGQDRLAVDMGVSERSVRTYLKELQDSDLVTIRRRGLGLTNVYVLHRLSRPANIADQDRKSASAPEVQDFPPKKTQTNKTQEENVEASKGLSLVVDNPDDARQAILPFASDLARELNDQAPLSSTTTRLTNLYHGSGLDLDAFLDLLIRARAITQTRTPAIRTHSSGLGPKPKMPYFLTVLEDLIGQAQAATGTGDR